MSNLQNIQNVLIITAHPVEDSLTRSLAVRIAEQYSRQGIRVDMNNLDSASFQPAMTNADLGVYHGKQALPDDILAEQARVDSADMLVFVFPVYWWSVPGILKGWFDRVLTNGWAYKTADDGRIVGIMKNIPVRLVAIAGSDKSGFDRHGYTTAIHTQIVEGVFGFCGLKDITLDYLYEADTANSAQIDDFLKNVSPTLIPRME
ncbi:Glutathione-regulated potassium-efflux system ancillary protein KefF [compost metagenome]